MSRKIDKLLDVIADEAFSGIYYSDDKDGGILEDLFNNVIVQIDFGMGNRIKYTSLECNEAIAAGNALEAAIHSAMSRIIESEQDAQ
jgi:hypothetical protein